PEEGADEEADLEDPSEGLQLTFNLGPSAVQFSRHPFVRELYLQNRSPATPARFYIQTHPPNAFACDPAFGEVPAGGSRIVSVAFDPYFTFGRRTEVTGFLRLRTAAGFPLERIVLKGFLGPSIKLFPTDIDFGMCAKGETKSAVFMVHNLWPVECPLVLLPTSAAFRSSFAQITLLPKEKRTFSVTFAPESEEVHSAIIYVAAGCGAVIRVSLRGVGGEPLRVLDTKLDFGPTDVFYGSVSRRLFLQNRDVENALDVLFDCSSDEMAVNGGRPVTLLPGELKAIPIKFTSVFTGPRTEALTLEAPASSTVMVEALAFSGPSLLIPIAEEVFFPMAVTSVPVSVLIPITNLTSSPVQCTLTLPPVSPFTLRLLDPGYANRKTLEQTSIPIQSRSYDTPDSVGVQLTLGPRFTAVYEVTFLSDTWGTFRCPLTTATLKPRRQVVCVHNLNAAAVNEVYMMREKPQLHLEQFLKDPSGQPTTGVIVKRGSQSNLEGAPMDSTSKHTGSISPSEVFEVDPTQLTCFGFSLSNIDADVFEFVTLSNVSNAPQPYQLLLSRPFFTEFPITGELPPLSAVDIPVRLDVQAVMNTVSTHAEEYAIYGQITILDSTSRQGMVSVSLVGLVGHLVTLEMRKGTRTVKYPHARVMEKLNRKIFVRNRTPFEIVWEGRVVPLSRSGAPHDVTDWSPFGLGSTRMTLNPFELGVVDVMFQATSTGDYRARLVMDYVDPVVHVVNDQYQRQKAKRDLPTLELYCAAGYPEIELESDIMFFGDVLIGPRDSRLLTLSNNQPKQARLGLVCPEPLEIDPVRDAVVSLGTPTELTVSLEPLKPGHVNKLLTLFGDGFSAVVPILASCGTSELSSNLAVPLKLTDAIVKDWAAPPENTIQLGIRGANIPLTKVLHFTNTGTFDLTVRNIAIGDDQHLRWRLLDDYDSQSFLAEAVGLSDLHAPEVDWDEIAFRSKDDRKTADAAALPQPPGEAAKTGTFSQKKRRSTRSVSIASTPTSNLLPLARSFPLRLVPRQILSIALTLGISEKGMYSSALRIDTERSAGEPENFRLWIQGMFQPALQLQSNKIDFGIKAVHTCYVADLRFSNTGSIPLRWSLVPLESSFTPVQKFETRKLPEPKEAIRSPFALYPRSGTLGFGCTQSVEVTFSPSLPQYDACFLYQLKTEDFAEAIVTLHGVGASTHLISETDSIDFGVLLVGTTESRKISIRNKGILRARYFVECRHVNFTADPEQGLIEGDGLLELSLTFSPRVVGVFASELQIVPTSAENYPLDPLVISIIGIGSYPELVVGTKFVDFGVALYGAPNVKPVRVENRGSAQAVVLFSCHHPSIKLEPERGKTGEIVLPAHTVRDLSLVFTPYVVEFIDLKVFIKSSDTRGDYHMIHIKGSVGVPKLVFEPPDITTELDFGVCALKSTQKKTFAVRNEGNIRLTFSMNVELLSAVSSGMSAAAKQFIPRESVISIDPPSGTLDVGEAGEVSIYFHPDVLATYHYRLILRYDYREIISSIKGVGGRAILQINSPVRTIDFGTCRMGSTFRKSLVVSNLGNLGVAYSVSPSEIVPEKGHRRVSAQGATVKLDKTSWVENLKQLGFSVLNPEAGEDPVSCHLKLMYDGECDDLELRGRAASPALYIADAHHKKLAFITPTLSVHLGIHPINSEFVHTFLLVNDSPFGIDFLIQPIRISEFDVFPTRGFVEPDSSAPVRIFFRPSSESQFHAQLRILYEREAIVVDLHGSGGIGKLEVSYVDEKDTAFNGIDFEMVPFNTAYEKHFYAYNSGLVPITLLAEVDNEDFTIAQIGEPFLMAEKLAHPPIKRTVWNWHNSLKLTLAPGTGIELAER
ncbi:hypothetical protein HK405_011863, partial [Cladochytrium tenue]